MSAEEYFNEIGHQLLNSSNVSITNEDLFIFAEAYHKHKTQKALEGMEGEIEDHFYLDPTKIDVQDLEFFKMAEKKLKTGAKWALNEIRGRLK